MTRHGLIRRGIAMAVKEWDFIKRATLAAEECAQSTIEKIHNQSMDTDKMTENFAICGLKRRAAALESLDAELRGEIDSGSHNLRRRVQLMALRKKMGSVHEALRKAKR